MWRAKLAFSISFAFLLIRPQLVYAQTKLPISFDVQPGHNRTVIIQWNCKPEIDSFNYEIEKSTDKQTWRINAQVIPQSSHTYSTTDSSPSEGLNYYRIKQIKNDGQVLVSDVKWIQINNAGRFYLWPNPATTVLHIKTTFGKGSINLFDSEGKFLLKISITDFITDIPTSNLAKGIYFLHIRHDKETFVEKFVKD